MNEELPTTGVPLLFVPIDEVPLDANGKRDRAALLIAPLPVPDADEPYVARRLLTRSANRWRRAFARCGPRSWVSRTSTRLAAEPCHAHVQVGAHDRRPGT